MRKSQRKVEDCLEPGARRQQQPHLPTADTQSQLLLPTPISEYADVMKEEGSHSRNQAGRRSTSAAQSPSSALAKQRE